MCRLSVQKVETVYQLERYEYIEKQIAFCVQIFLKKTNKRQIVQNLSLKEDNAVLRTTCKKQKLTIYMLQVSFRKTDAHFFFFRIYASLNIQQILEMIFFAYFYSIYLIYSIFCW